MEINELVKKAHENAVIKGFYDCPVCKNSGRLYDKPCSYCNGSGKEQKNIGELLMLIVSELGEALEAHRNNDFADFNRYETQVELSLKSGMPKELAEKMAFKSVLSSSFEFEIADAVIRIFDLCGYMGIDLEKHIELKMKYNETREYKHGYLN